MSMRSYALVLLIVWLLPGLSIAAPKVVVSIHPVHSLVSGLMEGVAEPVRLISPGASPHNYAMTVSDRRALQDAQLIIWVGPELETFLQRPLRNLDASTKQLTLLKDVDLVRLANREGGVWEAHDHSHDQDHGHSHNHDQDHGHSHNHDHDHGHSHNHDHDHGHSHSHADHYIDSHIWLSPENARRILIAVKDVLIDMDPVHAQQYQDNLQAMLQQLNDLDQSLQQRLQAVQGRPFIVFHDAYQYFEQHYGLTPAGSITLNPATPPGARRLSEIRARIAESEALCVFSEPQFRPAIVNTLIEGTQARTGVLDPLGTDTEKGRMGYFQLLENLAESLLNCLALES